MREYCFDLESKGEGLMVTRGRDLAAWSKRLQRVRNNSTDLLRRFHMLSDHDQPAAPDIDAKTQESDVGV